MVRKQQRDGSIRSSGLVCFVSGGTLKRAFTNEREEVGDGQGVTFGLWGSLAGPPSSFTSVFGLASGLIITSPDIPVDPSTATNVDSVAPNFSQTSNMLWICTFFKVFPRRSRIKSKERFQACLCILLHSIGLNSLNEWCLHRVDWKLLHNALYNVTGTVRQWKML